MVLRVGDRFTMLHGATGTPESTTSAGDLCCRLESNIDLIPAAPPALASPTVPLPAAAIPAAGSSCSGGSGGAKDDCEVVCLASPEKQPADAVALSGAGGGHGLKKAREEMTGSGSEEESGGGKEYAETVTCAICLDLIVDAWSSGCQAGHTFCRECVEPVLQHSPGAGAGGGTAASSSSSSSASAAGLSECPTCSEPVSGGGRGNVMVNQLVSCMVKNRTIKGDLAAEYERRTGMLVQKKLKTDRKKLLPETQQPEAIETGAAARSGSSSSSSSGGGIKRALEPEAKTSSKGGGQKRSSGAVRRTAGGGRCGDGDVSDRIDDNDDDGSGDDDDDFEEMGREVCSKGLKKASEAAPFVAAKLQGGSLGASAKTRPSKRSGSGEGSDESEQDEDQDDEEDDDSDDDMPEEWHTQVPAPIRGRIMEVFWCRASLKEPWWPGVVFNPMTVDVALRNYALRHLTTKHLVKYYGLSGAGSFECVAFGNVKPFLEHFDELAPLQPPGSKGKSKQLTSRQKAQREDGIKMAMKDAKIKDKWRRAL